MPNPYIEISKTYFRRLFSSWTSVCWLLGGLGFLAGSIPLRKGGAFAPPGMGPATFFVMGLGFLSTLLWFHFCQLVVNQNRTLFPRAAVPNVVVFAVFAIIITILWPALLRPTLAEALPLIGFALAWFALAGWIALLASQVVFMFGLGLFFWGAFFMFAPFDRPVVDYLEGNYPAMTFAVVLLGILATAMAIVGLLRLTADDPRFGRSYGNHLIVRPRVTGENSQMGKRLGGTDLNEWLAKMRNVYVPHSEHFWPHVRRWRQLTRGGAFFAFFFIAVVTTVQFEVMRSVHSTDGIFIQSAMWFFFMPTTFVMQTWLGQWKYLEPELLRPMARSRFLAEIAAAIGLDLLQCSVIFLIEPIGLGLAYPGVKMPPEFFPVAAASLIFNYTLILWLLRWHSLNVTMLGIFIVLAVDTPLAVMLELNTPYHWPALLEALLMLIAAALFWRNARRRWMLVELG